MSFEKNKEYLRALFGKLDYGTIHTDNDERLSIQDNGNNIMCLLNYKENCLVLHKVPLCTPGIEIREKGGKKWAKIHPFDVNNNEHVKRLEELFGEYYIGK